MNSSSYFTSFIKMSIANVIFYLAVQHELLEHQLLTDKDLKMDLDFCSELGIKDFFDHVIAYHAEKKISSSSNENGLKTVLKS